MSSKIVKTREFLRNFKTLKEQLKSGRVHFVRIDIGDDRELELSIKKPGNTAGELLRLLETLPKPRHKIRRTRIFDTLIRNYDRSPRRH